MQALRGDRVHILQQNGNCPCPCAKKDLPRVRRCRLHLLRVHRLGAPERKIRLTRARLPEFTFDPARKYALLKTFQEIPVGHTSDKITNEPGRGCRAQVIPADPWRTGKFRKNF